MYQQQILAVNKYCSIIPGAAGLFNWVAIFFLLLTPLVGASQAILWQKCIGGSAFDNAADFEIAKDGSYVVVGTTRSYDIPNLKKTTGDPDMLVFKMNSKSNLLWQKTFGGERTEEAKAVRVTRDGGFLIVGYTDSQNTTKGEKDFYIVRLDAVGTKLWEKSFGGTGNDIATSAVVLRDSSFLIAGETGSQNGNVTKNRGGIDYWVIRLDKKGNFVWEKTFGGPGNDNLYSIEPTADGNFLLVGSSDMAGGDVPPIQGKTDLFLVKIDAKGNTLWQKTYGGDGFDIPFDAATAITQDGPMLIAGTTTSSSGDISAIHGASDVFIAAVDQSGALLWKKSYGGSGEDGANSISAVYDGNFLISGTTRSKDQDILENKGGYDAWLFKVDPKGNMLWSKTTGGKGTDQFLQAKEIPGGDFIVIGFTDSRDGDLNNLYRGAGQDFWVVKIEDPAIEHKVISLTPTTLIGYIRDAKTKKFVAAEVRLVSDRKNKRLQTVKSDTVFGIYEVFLPDTDKASIGVSAKGYLFFSKDVTVSKEQRYSEIRLDISLEPIKVGEAIRSYGIYFDPGKFDILPESYPELDRLYDFLIQNKSVKIQVNGHTDGSGDPATKMQLSTLRARAVRDFLVKKGISLDRLKFKGYAASQKIKDPELTEEDLQLNRRVEFEIIEY